MLSVSMGERSQLFRSQYVDRAASVNAGRIWCPPGPRGDIDHTRYHPHSYPAGQHHHPASIENLDPITIFDTTFLSIYMVDENSLGEGFFQPIIIIMCRVHSVEGV